MTRQSNYSSYVISLPHKQMPVCHLVADIVKPLSLHLLYPCSLILPWARSNCIKSINYSDTLQTRKEVKKVKSMGEWRGKGSFRVLSKILIPYQWSVHVFAQEMALQMVVNNFEKIADYILSGFSQSRNWIPVIHPSVLFNYNP